MSNFDLTQLVGMTIKEAEDVVLKAGLLVRVAQIGRSSRGDCAHLKNRINLLVKDEKVTKATVG